MSDIGRTILADSFAIIDRELGPLPLPPWARAVVQRMVHASADFDFAHALRYSHDFEARFCSALSAGTVVVTDTEMVLAGIGTALSTRPEMTAICHIRDPETIKMAAADRITRSAAALRRAACRFPRPVLAIGNAPTALEEALRLVAEGWQPTAIIGIPVGFVGVVEAKERLVAQDRVPYLTCLGRKGGSAVTAAALNALISWFNPSSALAQQHADQSPRG